MSAESTPWQEMLTTEQRKFLNALCGDLAAQIVWHGNRLTKDDWRHMISGTVKGWQMVPGINTGHGEPGFVMLGGSSLKLLKAECVEAINMALEIGDRPDEQGLKSPRVRWSDTVLRGLGFNPADFREAA